MKKLDALLKPKSIAIIGVTDKPGTYGCRAATNIVNSTISDHVYYVNPKRDELFGRRCFHSVSEIPEVVDCIVLCVPKQAVCGCLEEAGSIGVKAAVVYASGFNEEQTDEGRELERQLTAVAAKYNMEVAGPNTAGLCNKIDNISLIVGNANFRDPPLKSGIAIAGQSGFIAGNLNQRLGDCLSYAVGSGNGSVTCLEDYLNYFVEDEHVNSIGVYLEGVKDAEKFETFLREAAIRRKPVVILKSGKSKIGASAAASHTGNLAGSSAAYESVFKKFGVISVDTLEEFVSTAKIFSVLGTKLPAGSKIAAVNFSGGENTICADMCERVGVEFAVYSEETMAGINELLPSFATAANPLDATTDMFADSDKLKTLLTLLSRDPEVGMIVLGSEMNETLEAKDRTILKVIREMKNSEKGLDFPVFLVPSLERQRNVEAVSELLDMGVPLLSTGEIGYRALTNLCRFINYDCSKYQLQLAPSKADRKGKTAALSELDSKLEIAAAGIPVPAQALVSDKSKLRDVIAGMNTPLALKICSPDILHKTEAGGVKLNIMDIEEAERAFDAIMSSCRNYAPTAKIDGILVQEMAPSGTEMIIGIKNDIQFGQMILVGMGGVFVEVFKDVALRPCPINKTEAEEMIHSLKAFKLLNGYRGSAACDVDALADIMVSVSQYATENADVISEMDINPIFVYEKGKGACAVDALIVKYLQ